MRCYPCYGQPYRDIEGLPAEPGVDVDHVAIHRRLQRFTPLVIEAAQPCQHSVSARLTPPRGTTHDCVKPGALHRPIRDRQLSLAVDGRGERRRELFGVGPVIAAMLIGYPGDIERFANRDHYAAYNGTAPVEFSSAGRTVHRVSKRGNRQLNHALHMAVSSQLRQPRSAGRVYVDRRVAEGQTKREAIRALKRHLSNAVYRQLVIDAHPAPPTDTLKAREHNRTRLQRLRGRLSFLHTGSSARSLADPPSRYAHRHRRSSLRAQTPS